ncbi:MAG: twin-arginine translocase subunit TatB [Deltaproteobacteria bacterium]|nr:MAG: twin-arginine translocase subunit TatB [Deltaproteobacteria bacterium]
MNMGFPEVATILVAALLLLGPQKLPEFARWLGRMIREVRKTTQEVRDVINLEIEKEEIERLRKEFAEHVNIDPSLELEKAAQDWISEVEQDADADDHIDDHLAQELTDAVENQQMYPTKASVSEDTGDDQPEAVSTSDVGADETSSPDAETDVPEEPEPLPVIAPPEGSVARGRSIHSALPVDDEPKAPLELPDVSEDKEPVPVPATKATDTPSS